MENFVQCAHKNLYDKIRENCKTERNENVKIEKLFFLALTYNIHLNLIVAIKIYGYDYKI